MARCAMQRSVVIGGGWVVVSAYWIARTKAPPFQSLIRIEQFDNFIFDAVKEAVSCSNTEAGLRLKVSRELLDHAWMEFKGETKERDWDPRLDWPETHESCSH